jgi:hypothetical protein
LRLLTNESVMGRKTLPLGEAWRVYDGWSADPRIELRPEQRDFDSVFRRVTQPFAAKPASKWIGDCYLLAFALCAGRRWSRSIGRWPGWPMNRVAGP